MNNQAIASSRPRYHLLPRDYDGSQDILDADFELAGESRGIDLRAIWATILRERKLILVILLLALAAGVASILLSRTIYRAQAAVQVEEQLPNVLGTQELEPAPVRTEADRFLKTQVDILNSRAMAAAVVEKLKLDQNRIFAREADISADNDAGIPVSEQAINAVQERMTASSPRDTRILKIFFDSGNAELAASVANGFADNFVASNVQRRFDTFSHSRNYLQKQIDTTKVRLAQSERALIAYSRAAGIVDASGAAGAKFEDGGRRSLTTANLVELNAAYAQARSNSVQAQQRWQQAQATPLMSLPEVLSNPAIQDLTRQRAEFEAVYEEELQRRKEEHPSMAQAKAKIKELDRQISALASSIRTSIDDQARVAQRQEGALLSAVGQLKSATLSEQDKGVHYNILRREVDTNRDLFNSLLLRYNQISSQAGLISSNIAIVDRAIPPISPIAPRPWLNMTLASLGGLLLGLIAAFARDRFRDKIDMPNEVEDDLGVPLLGVVPKLEGDVALRKALDTPRSAIVEAHHTIAWSLDARAKLPPHSVLLLTSSQANEGKSTTAATLGSNLAGTGKRVLLVDGDMRRGSLHRVMGLPNDVGLSNLLNRELSASEAVQYSDVYKLPFISRGTASASPAELLAGEAMTDFLQEVRANYDIIIIDGPPVLGLADAPRLAAAADGTLFVMAAHYASKEAARIALRRLATSGTNVVGLVLTKFDVMKAGGHYGYGYTYEYGEADRNDELTDETALALPA
jgi:capsular exopolysaccharide synthesis family protein